MVQHSIVFGLTIVVLCQPFKLDDFQTKTEGKECASPLQVGYFQNSGGPVHFDITSPLYPANYSNNQECNLRMYPPRDKIVGFRFDVYNLSQPGDYVLVTEGKQKGDVVLKNFSRKTDDSYSMWTSSGPGLWLEFKSDESGTDKGFSLTGKVYDKPRACKTVQYLRDQPAITSPFYPSYYPNNQLCTWLVIAPKNKKVNIKFDYFDLAQPGDYVLVRDGSDDNSVVLGNFSRKPNLLSQKLSSSGRDIMVIFRSDRQYTAKGFKMNITFQDKSNSPSPTSPVTSTWKTSTNNITTKNTKSRNIKNTSSIIAIAVGVGSGVLVLVILLLFYVFIKKRNKKQANRQSSREDPLEVSLEKVELLQEIGHGAFGKVWKGRMDIDLKDTNNTDGTGQEILRDKQNIIKDVIVAVKMLHDGALEDDKKEFLREIDLMKNVGCHRNIISMVACCTKEEQVLLVVEFARYGDLLNFLREKRKKTYVLIRRSINNSTEGVNEDEKGKDHDSAEELLEELMSFSWQIAQGMEYLSSKGIVHRDLATRNILLADGFVAKVADFGLSRHVTYEDQVYQAQGRRKLPLKWMSPEAIDDQIFTSKSDVWSYGVVLWEIYSLGKLPYRTVCKQQLLSLLKEGYRMDKPDLCPDDVYSLMKDCWKEHAQDRPPFNDVIQRMETFMTRDKPYVEFMGLVEDDDGYLVPSMNSDPDVEV